MIGGWTTRPVSLSTGPGTASPMPQTASAGRPDFPTSSANQRPSSPRTASGPSSITRGPACSARISPVRVRTAARPCRVSRSAARTTACSSSNSRVMEGRPPRGESTGPAGPLAEPARAEQPVQALADRGPRQTGGPLERPACGGPAAAHQFEQFSGACLVPGPHGHSPPFCHAHPLAFPNSALHIEFCVLNRRNPTADTAEPAGRTSSGRPEWTAQPSSPPCTGAPWLL